jgi:DNA-directed RNA polymerase specialized sigma54-like protein
MSAGLHLSQRLSQQMVLSPQLQQSLALLQAPVLELKAMVEQELQQNPVLEELAAIEADAEIKESKAEAEATAADPTEPPEDLHFDPATEKPSDEPVDKFAEDMQKLLKMDEEWRDVFAQTNSINRSTPEDEERRQHMFDSLTSGTSLQEHLLEQVRFSDLTPGQLQVAELIIGNIDDRGYLTSKPEELTFSTGVATEQILEVLQVIQTFEPPGVGARDLRECLMLQMERAGRTEEIEYIILRDYMEELGKRRFPEIARQLDITPSEAQDAAARLARLDPRPGSDFSTGPEQYVVPELAVQKTTVIDDSPDVLPDDIEDPESLADTLLEPDDEVARMVRGRLSIDVRRALDSWRNSGIRDVPRALLESLATELTRIVRGTEQLFDEELLSRISLSTAARRRLEGYLRAQAEGGKEPAPTTGEPKAESEDDGGQGETQARANRWLLADFFPLAEKRERSEFTVTSNDEFLPHLRISNTYKDLLAQAETSPEVREYIRDKIKAGKFLIKSLHQRQSTILNIGREIVKRQKEFLEKGVEHLRPMTMVQVAEVVGVHETTVSRAVSGKYIVTPQGQFEMKYFFTSGVATSDGQTMSNTSVKNILSDLISGEDRAKPLSDDQLVTKLKEKGIILARRTVAKYRAELNVLPSHLRRAY